MASSKRMFLLDGMALIYRAYFALIRSPRLTSKGLNTSAVFGFANSLFDILQNEEPTHLAVAFDTPEPTQRHEEFEEYKAQRQETPEDLSLSIPYVHRLLESFRIPVLECPGYEADDIIGTLARQAETEGYEVYMVTPDKDFAQLVTEKTFIYKPGRSGAGAEIQGVPEVLDNWSVVRVEQVVDILGLWGDTSDNIPGVPGIGEKTAKKLIAKYGSLENLLEKTDELKGKQKQNLEEFAEQGRMSKRLVTIVTDAPVSVEFTDLEVEEPNHAGLKKLFLELEFNTLGKRLFGDTFSASPGLFDHLDRKQAEGADADGAEDAAPEMRTLKTIKDVPHEYVLVETEADRAKLIKELAKQQTISFDVETTSLDPKLADLVGIAFSVEPHKGHFVLFPEGRKKTERVLTEFRSVFEAEDIEKVGHNLKFDIAVLKWHGMPVRGKLFDTMLAHFLADPEMRHGLDFLSEVFLAYKPIPIEDLIGPKGKDQKSMRDVSVDQLTEYAVEDADVALQLKDALIPLLKERNGERVFHEVECPLITVLVDMEREGIAIDSNALRDYSAQLDDEVTGLAKEIFEAAGQEFNLNSPKQLGEIFFDVLQLEKKAKKTKTGQYATNEQVLTRLAQRHQIARDVLDYRMLTKLKNTYIDTLPEAVHPETGRVHTTYNQTWTATGRMQSHDPNLQNIPIRTERGREIRKAFVPRSDDHVLLSADYSQIELRIIAELSQDEAMVAAFADDLDVHAATASRVYDVAVDEVDRDVRNKAKVVNFGIIYGMSAFGLSQRLGIPLYEARDIIEQYFAQYPGIKKYIDETTEFARENGYVETITGRRRYLRDINSRNASVRQQAERNAINSPIQGTAADMIKLAMVKIARALEEGAHKSRMLLQVHDELLFDLHKSEEDAVLPIIEDAMKTALPMKVPIVVEMGQGENWLEAH